MFRSRVGVLCLTAATCGFAAIVQETTAAAARAMDDAPVETASSDTLRTSQGLNLMEKEAAIPIPHQEDAAVLQQPASSEVKLEELAAKIFALADAHPTKTRRGTLTALLGIAGLMFFFALHALAQAVRREPINQDVLFKHETGKVTFTGAGSIISLALFAAGLAEAILAPGPTKNRNATSMLSFPARGAKQAMIGKNMIFMAATAIALGWVIGAPQFIMMAGTTGLLTGFALRVLGLALLFSEMKKGVDFAKKLYDTRSKDRPSTDEKAEIDLALLIQLIDQALESEQSWEGVLIGKGLPLAEGLLSAAQSKGKKEDKEHISGAKQTGAVLNADTLEAAAQQSQEFEQQQERLTRDARLHNLVNAVIQASQELQGHPEILEQATQLLQQLETRAGGSAASRQTAPLVESLAVPAEEAISGKGSGLDVE